MVQTRCDGSNSTSPRSRPKRSVSVKNYSEEESTGIHWREENELNKALYVSLQYSHMTEKNSATTTGSSTYLMTTHAPTNPPSISSTVQSKIHAQRKFAQTGPLNNAPQTSLKKLKPSSLSLICDAPSRPKTEDFLTFLCLRGTAALPEHLKFFNYPNGLIQQAGCHTPDSTCSSDLDALNVKKSQNHKLSNSASTSKRPFMQKSSSLTARRLVKNSISLRDNKKVKTGDYFEETNKRMHDMNSVKRSQKKLEKVSSRYRNNLRPRYDASKASKKNISPTSTLSTDDSPNQSVDCHKSENRVKLKEWRISKGGCQKSESETSVKRNANKFHQTFVYSRAMRYQRFLQSRKKCRKENRISRKRRNLSIEKSRRRRDLHKVTLDSKCQRQKKVVASNSKEITKPRSDILLNKTNFKAVTSKTNEIGYANFTDIHTNKNSIKNENSIKSEYSKSKYNIFDNCSKKSYIKSEQSSITRLIKEEDESRRKVLRKRKNEQLPKTTQVTPSRPIRQVRKNVKYQVGDECDFVDLDMIEFDDSDPIKTEIVLTPNSKIEQNDITGTQVSSPKKTSTPNSKSALHKSAGLNITSESPITKSDTSDLQKTKKIQLYSSPTSSTVSSNSEKVHSIKTLSFYSKSKSTDNLGKVYNKSNHIIEDKKSTSFSVPGKKGLMLEVPTFYPTSEEFTNPFAYIQTIRPRAETFGMCRIVLPPDSKPDSRINKELRFISQYQYIHKMYMRWGSNSQKMACIKKHLSHINVEMIKPPLVGGIEVDLPKLYETIHAFGGLRNVTEKKTMNKVADVMKIPKSALERGSKLYDVYCKYLLSYDTLSEEEKQKLEHEVLSDHLLKVKNQAEEEDCVVKGRSMNIVTFSRLARNTQSMIFKECCDPTREQVEREYWKFVTQRTNHMMVQCGHVDSTTSESAPQSKTDISNLRNGWTFNDLSLNDQSIISSLGPLSGVTIPTLHLGMLYTTSCWSTDHHFLPYIHCLHSGPGLIWYSIAENQEEKFQSALRELVPNLVYEGDSWLPEDTVMISPDILRERGITVSHCLQKAGECIVVFTNCYTSTVSCGYTVAESLHFAFPDWIPYAFKAAEMLYKCCETQLFSLQSFLVNLARSQSANHQLMSAILPFLKHYIVEELILRLKATECGLKPTPGQPSPDSSAAHNKKRKSSNPHNDFFICDVTKSFCFFSVVIDEKDGGVWCLEQALVCRRRYLKSYKLFYHLSNSQLNEILQSVEMVVRGTKQ